MASPNHNFDIFVLSPVAWLRRQRVRVLQVTWFTLALVLLALSLAVVPTALAVVQQLCIRNICQYDQLHISNAWLLPLLNLSVGDYGKINVALRLLCMAAYVTMASVIIWHRPDDRMAVLGACMLLALGVTQPGFFAAYKDVVRQPQIGWAVLMAEFLATVLMTLFFVLFPRGRFGPGWLTWLPWLFLTAYVVVGIRVFPLIRYGTLTAFLFNLLWDLLLLSLAAVQIYRYRTAHNHLERQQTKWIMLGAVLGFGSYAVLDIVRLLLALANVRTLLEPLVVGWNAWYLLSLSMPLAFGMPILHARLYEIDMVISRTLVYGALSVCVVGIYVVVVSLVGSVLQTQLPSFATLLAVAVVAVAFQPLRTLLQRSVNQLVYGRREDPYNVLAQVGHRLGAALSPQEVIPLVAATVRDALKLPYAAVTLRDRDDDVLASASGTPVAEVLEIPLVYQHQHIGQLVLGQRAPHAPFTQQERRLLEDLSRQVSIAAHAVRLTSDLQRSRERVVTAREEERRRLQRDLHDELGPTLASLTMQLDAARTLMHTDASTSEALLDEVQTQLKQTVGNVRRLVYHLRPPVLDQVGLAAALREHLLRAQQTSNLHISFTVPDHTVPLPAATEVAAYYIAVEALNNTIRHARASRFDLRLLVDHELLLVASDDGVGIPAQVQSGVGLHSMRERADELGGSLSIEVPLGGGTTIRARLPIKPSSS